MDHDDHDSEFREFVMAKQDRLHRFAVLICGDRHRAEDIVQLALAKLYAVWHRIDSRGADAYVRRVIVNTAKSHFARLWTQREHSTDVAPEHAMGDTNTHTADRVVILAALARLPRRQRAVVVLRYWEDRSVGETAEILRCSQGAVKSHGARGLRRLRDLLSETYAVNEGMTRACPT